MLAAVVRVNVPGKSLATARVPLRKNLGLFATLRCSCQEPGLPQGNSMWLKP